jgi:chemotaxis protein MotB
MSGHGAKKKRGGDHGDHPDERWLVTYADLMTLLVALFMVLFSISSVNKAKLESLQHSLQDAFSGKILPGGDAIKEAGGTTNIKTPSTSPKESSLQPFVGSTQTTSTKSGGKSAAKEQDTFKKVKVKVDRVAAQRGLSGRITTAVTPEGLRIRLLTDDLLFESGSADARPQSLPLLKQVAGLLQVSAADHSLVISGNTDNQPIRSAQFQDNLALSTARAATIFRTFAHDGISPLRMTVAGRGAYAPIAANTTPSGRSLNRRVEILVPRTTAVAKVTIPSIKPDFVPTSK